MKRYFSAGALVCAFFFASVLTLLGQGSLTPPGAPAPLFKTLQQIEPRVDLQNAPASAVTTTDPNYHYIITQPGSYYLSANFGVTKTNGIEINAAGVTLDLNGFEIARTSGVVGNGIEITAASHRASIRNGSIRSFSNGVQSDFSAGYPRACAFRDLTVSGCTNYGILAGDGALVESCRAHDNSGFSAITANTSSSITNCTAHNNPANSAIAASAGCSVSNCTARNNTGIHAIYANSGSSLSNCAAYQNTTTYSIYAEYGSSLSNCTAISNFVSYGIYTGTGSSLSNCTVYQTISSSPNSYGIYANGNCTLTNCTSSNNQTTFGSPSSSTGVGIYLGNNATAKGCTAVSNAGDGIQALQRCQIVDCTANSNGTGSTGSGITGGIRTRVSNCVASENRFDGISVNGDSTIIENHASHNGLGAPAAGIRTTAGSGNRVDGNQVRDNVGVGILGGGGDVIIRNTAGANTTNYIPSSGSNFGALQSPDTATNPLGNIAY